MAQDTGGTSLKANAVTIGRKACCRARFDWADAGFGSQGSWTAYSTDEYIQRVQGSMSLVDWRQALTASGQGIASTVQVTMHNPVSSGVRRFSLANKSSWLYTQTSGDVRMKRATIQMGYYNGATPEYLNQITGYVTSLREAETGEHVIFEIADRVADAVLTSVNTELFRNTTPQAYIIELLDNLSRDKMSAGGGYGSSYLDVGTFPLYWAWCSGESVWDELNLVAAAQMGRVFFDKDGNFHFHDGAHWARAGSPSYRDPMTSQHDFTRDHFDSCQPSWDFRSQYTHVLVSYTPRYEAGVQKVYSSAEPLQVPPASSKEVHAEFRYPVYDIQAPSQDYGDFTATTLGGVDISSYVTFMVEAFGGHANLTVQNNHSAHACSLNGMTLRGRPVLPRQRQTYENDSAQDYKNTWRARNDYIQSYRQAEAIGEFALGRFSTPVTSVRLAGCIGLPWLEPGDRITVTAPNIDSADNAYMIIKIDWTYPPYIMSIDAVRMSDLYTSSNYAVIDTSKYGTGSGYGRLFY
jgi:hypothetical protein